MKRINLIVFAIVICVFISGYKTEEKESIINNIEIEKTYIDAYTDKTDNDAIVRQIIETLGKSGYIAIDSDNKVNMTCSDKLQEFINNQEGGKKASVQVIQVSYHDRFSLLSMNTNEGTVNVEQTYYQFTNNHIVASEKYTFEANCFNFTEEGYLMIEGRWPSTERYVLTLSEEEVHIALRVYQLEDRYRELCNKYISSVSYGLNNMFLTDWNQKDFSKLDFYDIFERFYTETYHVSFPYVMNENISIGNEYQIPADEFENVIMGHIQITKQELHELSGYSPETGCYIFRPRGFNEFDYADIPYPEVVSYKENEDGSITFWVNAVYPNENTSKRFSHMVVIKEVNGKTYYLSNQIVENQELNLWWHADRYTEEEWYGYYGDDL